MTRGIFALTLIATLSASGGAVAAEKTARPMADLLNDGAEVVGAGETRVWLNHGGNLYMCLVEVSPRFLQSLRHSRPRILFEAWPRAMCFNANSFE